MSLLASILKLLDLARSGKIRFKFQPGYSRFEIFCIKVFNVVGLLIWQKSFLGLDIFFQVLLYFCDEFVFYVSKSELITWPMYAISFFDQNWGNGSQGAKNCYFGYELNRIFAMAKRGVSIWRPVSQVLCFVWGWKSACYERPVAARFPSWQIYIKDNSLWYFLLIFISFNSFDFQEK